MTTDRRRYTRLEFEGEANVRVGAAVFHCEIVDISIRGALLHVPEALHLAFHERCALEILLGGGAVVIRIMASAARVRDSVVGLQFEEIDADSFAHLRRLIELNLGDQDSMDRELAALIGAHGLN